MKIKINPFNQSLIILIYIITFLTPLIFFPVTRDFLIYSKYYFFVFAIFFLLGISFGKFLLTRKFHWEHNPATSSVILIILSFVLSVILMSPNKIPAIFNPQYGLIMMVSLLIFYFYASSLFTKVKLSPVFLLSLSGVIAGGISLLMLLNPFRNAQLPAYWAFLQDTTFNTIGSSVSLLSFLIFVLVGSSVYMWQMKEDNNTSNKSRIVSVSIFILVILLAIIFNVVNIAQAIASQGAQLILPPFGLSWYAAVEVLKSPLRALFGVGVDNFAALYTQVKDIQYNLSDLWQVNSFNTSRSAILHILTETGLVGLAGFVLFTSVFIKRLSEVSIVSAALFVTSLIILIVLPPSFISYFMFFFSAALMASEFKKQHQHDVYEIDLSQILPIYIGIAVLYLLTFGATVYFMGRHFVAEAYFKRSLDAIAANSLEDLYENQFQALQYNPYNEEFRRNFSQTNLLVANNIASNVGEGEEISEGDRQTVAQAIQAAISEAKAAVALNPQKVTNWENLAVVYRQIINVAEGAPDWTVQSYQEAIARDPRNAALRLDLGGVYYLFQNYDLAQQLFEQAVALKSDWANAHYNLAWTYYQKELYAPAVAQMQVVVGLLDPATEEEDYKQAQEDLATFQQALEEAQAAAAEQQAADGEEDTEAVQPGELNLPSPPAAQVEPRLELPDDASPEAGLEE